MVLLVMIGSDVFKELSIFFGFLYNFFFLSFMYLDLYFIIDII